MPRLLLFAPCDNVLISGEAQSASLIVVFTGMHYPGPFPDPLPPNALAPLRWYVFSQWEANASDAEIEYTQKVTMEDQEGTEVTVVSVVNFTLDTAKPIHRIVAGSFGFPITSPGTYRLKLFLKRVGTENWEVVGDYPLQVTLGVPLPQVTQESSVH